MNPTSIKLHLLGYAYGNAGIDPRASEGPESVKHSPYLSELAKHHIAYQWDDIIKLKQHCNSIEEEVQHCCEHLAKHIVNLVKEHQAFTVIGGDHTSAIGTWSGAYEAIKTKGPLGLIWLDAHMDSHTPETSESMRLHGMPLATLLGHGYSGLKSMLSSEPKIKPEHLCLVGVRSFERGEEEFLKKLNVRIYFIDEVKKRGIKTVLAEAQKIVSDHTAAYGLSLDLDGIDPQDAPAVNAPEPNGISAQELCAALPLLTGHKKFIGAEIAEFDPHLDKDKLTEQLIIKLIVSCFDANANSTYL